jgi:hypothetical protein
MAKTVTDGGQARPASLVRIHQTLRVTSAMAAGVKKLWEVSDIGVSLGTVGIIKQGQGMT